MSLADESHRDCSAIRIDDRDAEHPLGFKDALRVVTQGTVARVGEGFLGGIDYLDNHDFTPAAVSSAR